MDDKIKVTPEMIEAGVAALCEAGGLYSEKASFEAAVINIFNAMTKAAESSGIKIIEN